MREYKDDGTSGGRSVQLNRAASLFKSSSANNEDDVSIVDIGACTFTFLHIYICILIYCCSDVVVGYVRRARAQ
jgi:hypothetical protein